MSLHYRFILPAILSSLAVLAGCGGTSNPTVNPPPGGSFSNSNLKGTYVFSVTGTDGTSNFVTVMGTLTANGQGAITGGVIDVNGTGLTPVLEAAINSGTYIVGADGRPTGNPTIPTGLITLQAAANIYTFDYVLTSSEHGLITEFDGNGSASGTLDLQATVTQANLAGQSYAFNFTGTSGVASAGNALCGLIINAPFAVPYGTVGDFALDSSGNITTGVEDFNNNCSSAGAMNVPVTSGSVKLGTATFGTASIATTIGGTTATYSFDVFPIDATHLKFIEVDTLPILVGDAFTQTSSIPAGNNVFTVAGFDSNANVGGPFTAAGLLVTDSSGNVTSGSVEDINDAGVASEVTGITGSSTALTGGRAELTFLTGFVNGNNGTACAANCIFAVYPSSGGLQMLEVDDGGMTNGIAYPQTATTLASAEGYGMNLSGATSTSAEDDIAEFTNNNGGFGGIIDFNDQGSTSFKNSFSANYAADATVAGRGTVTHPKNGYLLTTYVVDNSTAVAVSTDPNLVALGALVKQNASAKSNVVAAHLAVLRAARPATQKTKRSVKRQAN
jgi:hypothetical protein